MHAEVIREVEQFLYREARLLDERRFQERLALFTDDIRYWMAGRSDRYPQASKAIAILDPNQYTEEGLTKEGELAIFDETKGTLGRRIARLETGMAWVEVPASRTRHVIANIEVEPGEAALVRISLGRDKGEEGSQCWEKIPMTATSLSTSF